MLAGEPLKDYHDIQEPETIFDEVDDDDNNKVQLEIHNLVSIVVPLYNQKEFLKTTIESIFNQTFKNFEVIIVNDGSTEEELDTVLESLKRLYRVM